MKNKNIYEFLSAKYIQLVEDYSELKKEPIPVGDFDKLFDYEKRKQSLFKQKYETYNLLGKEIEDFTIDYIERRQSDYQYGYEDILKQKRKTKNLDDLIKSEIDAYIYGSIIDLYSEIAEKFKEELV